jgi:hypothetical protein
MQDSVGLNGYIECWRERDGKLELLHSGHNAINVGQYMHFFLEYITSRTIPVWDPSFGLRYPPTFAIDGIVIGSQKETGGVPPVWSTYAGTFAFGTNSNFSYAKDTNPSDWAAYDNTATFYGTFNFTGAATVNMVMLGGGSMQSMFFDGNMSLYAGCFAAKSYFGTDNLKFAANDILRINWLIAFGTSY